MERNLPTKQPEIGYPIINTSLIKLFNVYSSYPTNMKTTDGRTRNWTHGRTMRNHNAPSQGCGGLWNHATSVQNTAFVFIILMNYKRHFFQGWTKQLRQEGYGDWSVPYIWRSICAKITSLYGLYNYSRCYNSEYMLVVKVNLTVLFKHFSDLKTCLFRMMWLTVATTPGRLNFE